MKVSFFKNVKKTLPTAFLSLLMLVSCANTSGNGLFENQDKNNQNVERVDFDEVLKNVTKGYKETFNSSVKVSAAVSDAKIKNQKVTVIIELDGQSTLESYLTSNDYDSFPEYYESKKGISQENQMIGQQSSLAAKLLKDGLIDSVKGNFSVLMNGFYATTTYGRIEQIREFANVKNAYVSTIYNAPQVVKNETNADAITGIYENDTQYDGSNTIVAVLDSGFDYTHEVFSMEVSKPALNKEDVKNVLSDTVAYQMSNEKLTVDDVYISSKVPFAYDYAYGKADVVPVESDHGTHVSGIIGGASDKIKGIAPQTQFAWMKVFNDDDGGGDTADIVCALEDAVLLGVDAINMSLGAVGGYSEEVIPSGEINTLEERINKVYSSIEQNGVSLVVAAGNEYSSGYQSANGTNLTTNPESGTIGSPGSYSSSLTVASINGLLEPYALVNDSDTDSVFFQNAYDSLQNEHKFIEELFEKVKDPANGIKPDENGNYKLDYVTIPGDGSKVNYNGVNVKGKIAVVKRGNISFEDKVKYAYQKGALAVLIYNNVSGTLTITVGKEVFVPVALISMEAGNNLAKNKKGTLTFNESFLAGPFMSDFSSWGPLTNLELKPEITAHGGNIYSSILGGGYDSMSGTSMATPNTCGIVLVIRDYVKEKWPTLTPKEVTEMVNQILMSTATICLNEVGNPYSPRKQGAGLASLLNSVSTDAYLYVKGKTKTKLELGDDKEKTGVYETSFNIKNFSGKEKKYTVSNLTLTETVASDNKTVAETATMLNPKMEITVGEGLSLSGNVVTVPANTDATINVTLTLSEQDKKYIDDNFANGMYVEGYITLKDNQEGSVSTGKVDLNIPFLAFYGDWLKAPIFDVTYYDVEKDRVDGTISESDKTKAAMYATTPYGKYYDYYMIPLGGYIYEIPAGYDEIPATQEKAAISLETGDTVYELYTIYTGLMRGAKKLTLTITDASTGEQVYEKITYNNRKATYYGSAGGTLPLTEEYNFSMYNEETGEIFANNSKYIINMKAELDYENGDQVSNNEYEFSFYVDYEKPTLENVEFTKEWDKNLKKNRYYIELYVSDNRFVQAVRPCTIMNNTLISLVDDPIPVYQENANETTKVKIEITDYFADLKLSPYPDSIFFVISDYALNSDIYEVALNGLDDENLDFTTKEIYMKTNEKIDLSEYVNIENALLQGMSWSSTNTNVAVVNDGEVVALSKGQALITGTSLSYNTSIQVRILVNKETADEPINVENIKKVKFSGYTTKFVFKDDYEYVDLGEKDIFYYMPDTNSFEIYPSESFQLSVDVEPWYYDKSKIKIVYKSSNSDYVSVDENGVVVAIKETTSPVTIKAIAYLIGENDTLQETVFLASTTVVVKSPYITSGSMLQYYKGWGGEVIIPDDLGIQYIGEYAFSHYNYVGMDEDGMIIRDAIGDNTSTPITKIVVPEGTKYIMTSAFQGLTELEEVVLPSTTKDIYVSAFEGCSSLKTINLNNIVKIENYAFRNCSSLININKEGNENGKDLSNVVTMGHEAFKNTGITKVNLTKLRMAGTNLFASCKSLQEVKLDKLTPLSKGMFDGASIKNIEIPHEIIPSYAFANCENLENVVFTNSNVIINANAFKNSNINSITFADNTTNLTIDYNAFENCNITKLELPSCYVIINDEAFKGNAIKELVLNENTYLEFSGTPFIENESFASISINGTNSNYKLDGKVLLSNDETTIILVPSNVVDYIIPSNVTSIGNGAFAGNKATGTLVIPNTISSIGDFAFANSSYSSVDFINVNDKTILGEYLFYSCINLTQADNLDKLTNISKYMFAHSGLVSVTIGDNTTIGYGAFANTESLENVVIGNNAIIGEYAFYGAFATSQDKKPSITLSTGTIGEYAFAESNLEEVDGSNITEIGKGAFYEAKNLTSANFKNVIVMGAYAFYSCEKLTTIDISKMTYVPASAFTGNVSLKTVTGSLFTEIGEDAFFTTTALETIDLSNVKTIGSYAFGYSSALKSVSLDNLETLGQYAFMECVSLESVNNFSSKVKVIPEGAFFTQNQNGSVLKTIDLSNVEEIQDMAFYYSLELDNVELSNVRKIGAYAFYCSSIKNAELTNCISVDEFAFYNATLSMLTMPKMEYVGEFAFADTNVRKVDLSDTLKTIKKGAFASLIRLTNFTHNDELNYVCKDDNDNPIWMIADGVLYGYNQKGDLILLAYPTFNERKSYTVLDKTVKIEAYSFYTSYETAMSLEEITFPSSLEIIGDTAFGNAESLTTYRFNSYKAPLLECVYNSNVNQVLVNEANNGTLTDTADKLYHYLDGKIYSMYWYYYPYYYSNFVNFIGLVENLNMYYPSNGVGYDSWIYRYYFAKATNSAATADVNTSNTISLLDSLMDISSANEDNIDTILEVYDSYKLIKDSEQLALLDEIKVAHFMELYNQVLDILNPKADTTEINNIKGYYTGTDDYGTSYSFEITGDGSGKLIVSDPTNANYNATIDFDVVRHNDDGLQISSSNGDVFEFIINDDKTLTFKYYLTTITMKISNKPSNDDNTNEPTSNNGCKGSISSSLITLLSIAGILMTNKKRKNG